MVIPNNMIGDPYEHLAASVLIQAIEDYRNNNVDLATNTTRLAIARDLRYNIIWHYFQPDTTFDEYVKSGII